MKGFFPDAIRRQMSNALTPDAPEASDAAASVEDPAPLDGTAVESGSAATVDANRFNGLMSAHQKALGELESLKAERAALSAQLAQQQEENITVPDETTLAEVQALRAELASERLERVKAEALTEYPAAAPLADLIVGSTAEEIRSVTAAIATRLQGIAPVANEGGDPPVVEATPEVPAAPVAPVVAGGSDAPAEVDNTVALKEALQSQDWNAYWQAKAAADTSTLA